VESSRRSNRGKCDNEGDRHSRASQG
jgi:hypothetical protein